MRSAADPAGSPSSPGRLLGPTLLLAALSVAIAQTIVVSALAIFGRQLDVSTPAATWLLTTFMLAAGVSTPIAGRIGDLVGYRPVMLTCLGCLAMGSTLTALADEAGWFAGLLAGRALQGLSAATLPLAFGLARQSLAPERLPGLIAGLSAMFGVGGALGLVLAGPVVDLLGTPWLFWLTVPPALLAFAGSLPLARGRPAGARAEGLDLVGALLLSAMLVALLLAISQGRTWGWASSATLGLLGTAVLAGVAFARTELRSPAPMLDLRLLCGPALAAISVATLVIGVGMFAGVTVIPQLVQTPTQAGYGFAMSATETGLILAPVAAFMVLAAGLTTGLAARIGGRATFGLGAIIASLSLAGLGLAHDRPWTFYIAGAVLGTAYGFAFASLGGLLVRAVPPHQTGAATGVNTVLRTLGGAIGAQLAAVILTSTTSPGASLPAESGYTATFLAAAGVAALAGIAAAAMPAGRSGPDPAPMREPLPTRR